MDIYESLLKMISQRLMRARDLVLELPRATDIPRGETPED